MSKIEDQQQCPQVVSWTPGAHKRPSLPQWQGWSESPKGTWIKEGWTVQEEAVQVGGFLYRVFPPSTSKHVASFTVCNRAKAFVDNQLKSST